MDSHLSILVKKQFGHEQPMGDKTHPGEGKDGEIHRLEHTESITIVSCQIKEIFYGLCMLHAPYSDQQGEICST